MVSCGRYSLDLLPDSILLHVLFAFLDLLPDLQVCIFVSRRWRDLVINFCQSFLNSIQISSLEKQYSSNSVLRYVSLVNVRRISIERNGYGDRFISSFFDEITGCGKKCFSSLESICIGPSFAPQRILLTLLKVHCVSLKELRIPLARPDSIALVGCTEFPHLEILDLTHRGLSRKHMEKFHGSPLKWICLDQSSNFDFLAEFASLDRLEVLYARQITLKIRRIHEVLIKTPKLKILDLTLSVVDHLDFQIALESLEVLNLTRTPIRKVSLHVPILRSLIVSFSKISPESLLSVSLSSSSLKTLLADGSLIDESTLQSIKQIHPQAKFSLLSCRGLKRSQRRSDSANET